MNILFVDIETAPEYLTYEELPQAGQIAFLRRVQWMIGGKYPDVFTAYKGEAGFLAEFSQIVCIGVGRIEPGEIRVKAITGTEDDILNEFNGYVNKVAGRDYVLCAHNGKEFDFPFINRREIIRQIPIPDLMQVEGKKTWNIPHIDTMEIWAQGQWKHFVSLPTLCYCLGVASSKGEMDGSMVADAYHAGRIEDIAGYCRNDVIALIRVFGRMRGVSVPEKVVIA